MVIKFESLIKKIKSVKNIKLNKKRIIILSVALALIIALSVFLIVNARKNGNNEEKAYTTAYAMRGDVTETISQSGMVEPYERREITSLVKGEIILSEYEEGDFVEENATIYKIDDEDAQLQIEKASIEMQDTYDDIAALNIYAQSSGTLSEFNLEAGNDAPNGKIGYITNTGLLTADIPFTSAEFNKISVGDSVSVTSALYMTSLDGKVVHKYNSVVGGTEDGASVKNIEVNCENPGSMAVGTTVAAVCHTLGGDVYSSGSGEVSYNGKIDINNEVQGSKVSKTYVKSGDRVTKGQLLAVLSNRSLDSTRKSRELSLKSSQKTLENYNITAPISGPVITKKQQTWR